MAIYLWRSFFKSIFFNSMFQFFQKCELKIFSKPLKAPLTKILCFYLCIRVDINEITSRHCLYLFWWSSCKTESSWLLSEQSRATLNQVSLWLSFSCSHKFLGDGEVPKCWLCPVKRSGSVGCILWTGVSQSVRYHIFIPGPHSLTAAAISPGLWCAGCPENHLNHFSVLFVTNTPPS